MKPQAPHERNHGQTRAAAGTRCQRPHPPSPPSRECALRELDPAAVIARNRINGYTVADEFRTHTCPSCGERDRDAVSVNLVTGRWYCHARGCRGDVLSLLAGYSGIGADPERFPELLDEAGRIIRTSGGRAVRQLHVKPRGTIVTRWTSARIAAAVERAARSWASLVESHDEGEAYLDRRGVRDLAPGLVRFTPSGDPAVALWAKDGRLLNVVRRIREPQPGAAKVLGLRGCPTLGTFVDRTGLIGPDSLVVVTEGMFDALTARVAFPDAVVLGAHGAGNLARIAEAAARRGPRQMFVVPHDDVAGRAAVADAVARVEALGRKLDAIEVGAKDLNESWCASERAVSDLRKLN